jgi:transposase
MIQLVPQLRILFASKPIDFGNGIDGLAALCKRELAEAPFSGALFVFRNRRGTALRMLCYDGVGFYLFIRLGRISFRNVIAIGHLQSPRAQSRPNANIGQV